MKRMLILLAVLVAVTVVTAQAETGIAGTVTDAGTGAPIVGARVMVPRGGSALTNDDGDYLISLRGCRGEGGAFIVRAEARGYESAVYPETVYVERGQVVENIDFALEPGSGGGLGSITGEVTDATTGRIIRGALVTAEDDGVTYQVTQGCRRYRIALPDGRYRVSAEAPGYEPGAYGVDVEVVGGQVTSGIDIALERGDPGERGGFAGMVTDGETGEPLLGAHVAARGPVHGRTNTDETGAYLLDYLVPGQYVVTAQMRGYHTAMPETVEVVAGQVLNDIDFALTPRESGGETGFVAGTVTDAGTGDPIENAHISGRGCRGQRGAVTGDNGKYLLGLRPGAYLLRASARWYLPAVYPETVLVAAGETLFGIDFALEPVGYPAAAIGGWVFDGYTQTEIGAARVTAIGPERSFETETDDWGEYLFTGLEPGDYRIMVTRSGYEPTVYQRLVTVEPDEAASYATPAIYALTGVDESVGPRVVERLKVAPSLFKRSSVVRYSLPVAGHVRLSVTDVAGRVVAVLQDGHLGAGQHEARWDGTSIEGRQLTAGVYFYQIEATGLRALEKVVFTGR